MEAHVGSYPQNASNASLMLAYAIGGSGTENWINRREAEDAEDAEDITGMYYHKGDFSAKTDVAAGATPA